MKTIGCSFYNNYIFEPLHAFQQLIYVYFNGVSVVFCVNERIDEVIWKEQNLKQSCLLPS